MKNRDKPLRIAILDLYDGVANQGIVALHQIIESIGEQNKIEIEVSRFEIRKTINIPELNHDIYLSSGGPGSPIDTNQSWESAYFDWIDSIINHNKQAGEKDKKFIFFICHSFQLACRYFKLAHVSKRSKNAFGIYPIKLTQQGLRDNLFAGLSEEIWVVDSRDYQATLPDEMHLRDSEASILATESGYAEEKAIMAIRFNPYMAGTQFHPEANEVGLMNYINSPECQSKIIADHGHQVLKDTIEKLSNPVGIIKTYNTVIPNFIMHAVESINFK